MTILDGLDYPVIVAADASEFVARALAISSPSGAALVCDRPVAARMQAVGAALQQTGIRILGLLELTGGERAKRPERALALARWLIECGADRRTALVAIGGGTIIDVVGFAAAIFMRGIAWIAVPTTLLGMADAAIGGKTGVNLPEGKNLLGSFWDPIAVIADLASLDTLPLAQRRTGMAEMVKAAIVGDPELLERIEAFRLRARPAAWVPLVVAAARVKMRIVAADPRESGLRAALNLGHSVGHALEFASNFRLEHGKAVAIGLRAAGLLALALGRWSNGEQRRVLQALQRSGLPLHADGLAEDAIFAGLQRDKKRSGGSLRFVLPVKLGEVEIGVPVDDSRVREVVRACLHAPASEEL